MKLVQTLAISLALLVAVGCTGSTAVSEQPSTSEIEAAKQRRLAEIDKMNIPADQKERMKQQVQGGGATPQRQ